MPTEVMLRAAHRAFEASSNESSAEHVLESLIAEVDSTLSELAAEPWDEDSFDSLWDFGGELGAAALHEDLLAVARVGDLRVCELRGAEMHMVLQENTLAADLAASGRELPDAKLAHVVTDCLGRGKTLSNNPRLSVVKITEPHRLLIGPGTALGLLSAPTVTELLRTQSLRDAASEIARRCSDVLVDSAAHGPKSVGVVVIDVHASEASGCAG
jgi:hypothetical protein